jgi:hypothetical protein
MRANVILVRMNQSYRSGPQVPLFLLLQILGVVVFAIAFFLPAVNFANSTPGEAMSGWFCARFALLSVYHSELKGLNEFLVVLSGWINLITVAFLILSLTRKLALLRMILAALLPIFLLATWVFLFFRVHMIVFAGHYLWVIGALLIFSRELEPNSAV